MAKYDEKDFKENGRTTKIGSDVDLNLKVVVWNQLEKDALDVTNSEERVVSNPKSYQLVPGMSIIAEEGGFEPKEQPKTTKGRSKTGVVRERGER